MTDSDAMALDETRDFGAGVAESSFGQDAGSEGSVIQKQVASLKDQATDRIRGLADEGKKQVTDTIDGVVTAAREIADRLGDGAFGPVGDYADQAVEKLEHWAEAIKAKSIEELFDDGRDLARAQPALAIGIAVVAGFALSRLLKAAG